MLGRKYVPYTPKKEVHHERYRYGHENQLSCYAVLFGSEKVYFKGAKPGTTEYRMLLSQRREPVRSIIFQRHKRKLFSKGPAGNGKR